MTQKSEQKQGNNMRSWLLVMTSFAIVFAALSGIRSISLPAALVVAIVVVVAGIIFLKAVK